MANNNKMTQRDFFNEAIRVFKGEEPTISAEDMVTFFEGRITALDKKSSTKKATKTQVENVAYNEAIKAVLANATEGMTVSDIIKASAELEGLSNQKVSALLRLLVKAEEVDKITDKKRSLFVLKVSEG